MDLEELIAQIKEKMLHRDLSDEYLEEHNHSTREEIGIGEYAYGITMIPCEWILPFLEDLKLAKEALKDKCEITDERNQLLVENKKRDKIIDEMAKWLYEDDTWFGYGKFKEINTSEKIKQFFIKKVERNEKLQ